MIQKIAEAVFPLLDNPKNQGAIADVNAIRRVQHHAYTTASEDWAACMEWASWEGLIFNKSGKIWFRQVEYQETCHPCDDMTTPELYDYWYHNIKSKEK